MFKNLRMNLLAAGFLVAGLGSYMAIQAGLSNPIGAQTDPAVNNVYMQVYNADNVTHEVGDVVVWYDGSLTDGIEITTTTTANNSLVAGVVDIKDISATSYGLILVSGYTDDLATDTNVAAGDNLVTSTTGEVCTTYTLAMSTGALTNEAIKQGVFGVALTADSGAVGKAFIRLQ